jgi:predicted phosphodiesterase
MRYLVFGDVHGNIDALDAVLAAGNARGAEAYMLTGDLVGYGPSPLECVERMLKLQEQAKLAWVVGNHELAVRGEIDPASYSEEAARTLTWTRALIDANPAARRFIASGGLSQQVDELVWLTHDSLAEPGIGYYHRNPQNAKSELACLRYKKGKVCFYGHTHQMRAEFLREGAVVLAMMDTYEKEGNDPKPLRLRAEEFGWIGAGSVGFPTNALRCPEFLILDDSDAAEWRIEKYAVKYPRDAAKKRTVETLTTVCGKDVAERISRWQ